MMGRLELSNTSWFVCSTWVEESNFLQTTNVYFAIGLAEASLTANERK